MWCVRDSGVFVCVCVSGRETERGEESERERACVSVVCVCGCEGMNIIGKKYSSVHPNATLILTPTPGVHCVTHTAFATGA